MNLNIEPETLAKNIICLIWQDLSTFSKNSIKINMDKDRDTSLQFQKWVNDVTKLIKMSSSQRRYLGFFDGSARPNPGTMAIGGYIQAPDKTKLYSYSINLGKGTNNIAEYESLIHILNQAAERGIQRILIRGDSQLIINQVNRVWQVRDPIMKELHSKVIEAMEKIPSCEVMWQPREENKTADKLAIQGQTL